MALPIDRVMNADPVPMPIYSQFATYKCPDDKPNLDYVIKNTTAAAVNQLYFKCVAACPSTYLLKNRFCYPATAGAPMTTCTNTVEFGNKRCDIPRVFE